MFKTEWKKKNLRLCIKTTFKNVFYCKGRERNESTAGQGSRDRTYFLRWENIVKVSVNDLRGKD